MAWPDAVSVGVGPGPVLGQRFGGLVSRPRLRCGTNGLAAPSSPSQQPPQGVPTLPATSALPDEPAAQKPQPPTSAAVPPAAPAARVAVLIYHQVCWDDGGTFVVSPDRLAADLGWLLSQGWQPIDFAGFVAWHAGELMLTGDHFLLTFDDGYQGVADYALPLLQEMAIPAVLFLTTGDLDRGSGLTTPGARALLDSGLFSLQNHSHGLHHQVSEGGLWQAATTLASPAELVADLLSANKIIRKLGAPNPVAFAWPYGEHTPAATAAVRELFPLLFGTEEVLAQAGVSLTGRIGMDWRSHEAVRRLFGSLSP